MRRRFALLLVVPALAHAERAPGVCIAVTAEMTPTDNLQLVAWVERVDGTFVDTIFITNKVGRYGMGNRPGRPDFNTGGPHADTWPYGRREQTFPVWAHRHGKSFPKVVFQSGSENDLSHRLNESSPETGSPYCQPWREFEPEFDTGTCATTAYTDKGTLAIDSSLYPPRSDLMRRAQDTASVDLYRMLNPFDAVSRPTPLGGMPAALGWAAPQSVDYGDYVLFVEASKTYDFNTSYNADLYPSPTNISYADYGKAWRGQPSIVYRVPFTVAATDTEATTDSYVGYGDVLGQTGTLFPPDATITTTTPGSGASRLQLVSDGASMYRVRVRSHQEVDTSAPAPLGPPTASNITSSTASIEFTASGDDGMTGALAGYEIRVRANSPMTEANFVESAAALATVVVVAPGERQVVDIAGLMPETDYWIGIRPVDNCFNKGDLVVATFTTLEREVGEVPWCFVATAAYGSPMANDVEMLRRFRDLLLTRTVIGELTVETYYTFGPALAGIVGESELLRASARAALTPIIERVRRFVY